MAKSFAYGSTNKLPILKVTKTKNCNEKNNFNNIKRVLLLQIKVKW
jgi:hypothetical protein